MSIPRSIPASWQWVELRDVATVVTGNTPPTSDAANFGGSIPFIKPPQLLDRPIFDAPDALSDVGATKARLLPPKAVLVSCIGILGKTGITRRPAATNQQINAVVFDESVIPEYGFLYLQTLGDWLRENSSATTVPIINKGRFETAPLPVAPLLEQSRIVEKVEEFLSQIDAGSNELKVAQRKLTQYRQSLLKAAVEGALTADWRAERAKRGEPIETGAQLLERILREHRERWEAKQLAKFVEQGKVPPKEWKKDYIEPLPLDFSGDSDLPDGWVWSKVGLCGEVQLGRQRAPQFHTGPNMVPYLRVANVFENRIDVSDVMEMHFSEDEVRTFKLEAGDILLNEGQSLELVGRPAIYRNELRLACFTNTLVRFRAESGVIPEFALTVFLHYMHSGRFRKIAKITTNIAHLGAGRFADLEFPLPSTAEQKEIVSRLKEGLDNLERQQLAVSTALRQSAAQRKNILKAAFCGQLVSQDANDEPAHALLERLRAERAQSGIATKKKRPLSTRGHS